MSLPRTLLASALFLLPVQGRAEEYNCAPYALTQANLAEVYGEYPVGGGVRDDRSSIIIFASENGETFTIVSRDTYGQACVLTSGRGWGEKELLVGRAM